VYTNFNSAFFRHDLNNFTAYQLASQPSSLRIFAPVYCVSTVDKKPYIFATFESNTSGLQFGSYDITADSWTYMANPSWGGSGAGGVSAWDGRNKLYFFQGQNGSNFGVYDIPTGVWTAGPSVGTSTTYSNGLIFIKKTSANGLAFDRLYFMRGDSTTQFFYLNINPDGTPSGVWTAAAALPFTAALQGARIWNYDNEFIFYHTISDASGSGRDVRRYSVASNSWSTTSIFAAPENASGGDCHIGYKQNCFAEISDEGPTTNFWFIGSADRIILVTKNSLSQYDFIYAGLISSYYSRAYTATTTTVGAGVNQTVTLTDASGITVGQKIFIADLANTPTSPITRVGLDGVTRHFAAHEQTTVIAKSGNNITLAKINHNYPSGARVGIDLQPVGVTSYRSNTIHMNNHVNTTLSNATSGLVPQMYRFGCPTKTEITNQSAEESRTSQYMLWPMVIRGPWSSVTHNGTDYSHSGTEVRGQLNGVYVVDTTGSAAAEDYVMLLGNNYILFDMTHANVAYGESRFLAFGPL
jgi:hypothetical protein